MSNRKARPGDGGVTSPGSISLMAMIAYFTHVWKPAYHQFGVPEQNRQALRRINDQITRLPPEILSNKPKRSVRAQVKDEVKVDFMARELDGHLTLFAVNDDQDYREAQVGRVSPGGSPGWERDPGGGRKPYNLF